MGYVIDVLVSIWDILKQLVPAGIDPTLFWLSFILVTSVTYLLLSLVHLFKNNSGLRLLVAAIMGYLGAGSAFSTVFLATFFPNLTVGLFVILGMLMVFAMIAPGKSYAGFGYFAIIVLFAVIFGTWQGVSAKLGISSGGAGGTGVPGMTADDWAAIILIIAVIAIFVISTRKPREPSGKNPWKEFVKAMTKEI